MKPRQILPLCLFLTGCAGADREPITLRGEMTQGGMIVGKTDPTARLFLDGEELALSPNGDFVFGFGRDHPRHATLETRRKGVVRKRRLVVKARRYKEERIDGLDEIYVRPPPEAHDRIAMEARQKREARRPLRREGFFTESFIMPTEGRVSGVYGSRRILNGVPMRPHYGVDIAAPEGSAVKAPAGGIVILAGDFYFEGGLLFLDHGLGVVSAFLHLGEILVQEGGRVARGAVIGRVGKSGRATGAHLDWRVSWRGRPLDPMLLVSPR